MLNYNARVARRYHIIRQKMSSCIGLNIPDYKNNVHFLARRDPSESPHAIKEPSLSNLQSNWSTNSESGICIYPCWSLFVPFWPRKLMRAFFDMSTVKSQFFISSKTSLFRAMHSSILWYFSLWNSHQFGLFPCNLLPDRWLWTVFYLTYHHIFLFVHIIACLA